MITNNYALKINLLFNINMKKFIQLSQVSSKLKGNKKTDFSICFF